MNLSTFSNIFTNNDDNDDDDNSVNNDDNDDNDTTWPVRHQVVGVYNY